MGVYSARANASLISMKGTPSPGLRFVLEVCSGIGDGIGVDVGLCVGDAVGVSICVSVEDCVGLASANASATRASTVASMSTCEGEGLASPQDVSNARVSRG